MTRVKVLSPWLTCYVISGSSLYVFEPRVFSHRCYGGNNTCMSGLSHGAVGKNNPGKVWGSPL